VPIRRSVVGRRLWLEGPGADPGWAAVVDSIDSAVALPDTPGWSQVEEGLATVVSRCLFGQTTSLQLLLDGVVESAGGIPAGE